MKLNYHWYLNSESDILRIIVPENLILLTGNCQEILIIVSVLVDQY